MIPRLGPDVSRSREGGDSVLLDTRIKPPFPPALRGVDGLQAEIAGVAAHLDAAAAPFSTAAFTRTKAWDHQLSAEEMEEASPLLARIGGMLDKVRGIHLIATFVKRRVWPLRARAHPMWSMRARVTPLK